MSNAGERDGEDRLRRSESKYETIALWGGAVVIFGLVVEVVLTAAFAKGQSIVEEWGPVFADALIALGVACEVGFAAKARSRTEALKLLADKKVSEANERASEAQLKTEQLRKAMAWRSLDEAAFLDAISKSPAKPHVSFVYVERNPEAYWFANHLQMLLKEAGWPVEDPTPVPYNLKLGSLMLSDMPDAPVDAVGVCVVANSLDPSTQEVSGLRTLTTALLKDLNSVSARRSAKMPAGKLLVVVAPKP
jgi:hypothetical protein